jgi:hypothetical protein
MKKLPKSFGTLLQGWGGCSSAEIGRGAGRRAANRGKPGVGRGCIARRLALRRLRVRRPSRREDRCNESLGRITSAAGVTEVPEGASEKQADTGAEARSSPAQGATMDAKEDAYQAVQAYLAQNRDAAGLARRAASG